MNDKELDFADKLEIWAQTHGISEATMIAINEKRRVKDDSILLADCIPGTIDVNGFPDSNFIEKKKGF